MTRLAVYTLVCLIELSRREYLEYYAWEQTSPLFCSSFIINSVLLNKNYFLWMSMEADVKPQRASIVRNKFKIMKWIRNYITVQIRYFNLITSYVFMQSIIPAADEHPHRQIEVIRFERRQLRFCRAFIPMKVLHRSFATTVKTTEWGWMIKIGYECPTYAWTWCSWLVLYRVF